MIDWTTDDPVEQIEEYLTICGLEKDQVGLVVGPQLNEEDLSIDLQINIRVLEGDDTAVYAIDSVYSYEWMAAGEFLDEIYPEIIEELETSFEESQLQYYHP